jgi:acyl-CoA thioesterase
VEPNEQAAVGASWFPLADFLSMDVDDGEQGRAAARVETGAAHLNPHGTVHGAVLFAMVDTAMGAATMSLLDDEHWCASIDVGLRFFRPVFSGSLTAVAQVVHAGKRVVHLRAEVTGPDGKVVAMATGSFAVLPRPT